MTYDEAKKIVMDIPEVVAQGPEYVEEFIQGFMEAMRDEDELMDAAGLPRGEA